MAVDFWLRERRDEEAYPSGRCRTTKEQRNQSQKATAKTRRVEHFAASGGLARSLQTQYGYAPRRLASHHTNCSSAVPSYL